MYPLIYLNDHLALPTYYLWISLVFCLSLIWVKKRAQKKNLSKNIALDLSLMIMLGGFVGARLFHVFFESPEYYLKDPMAIFSFWQGGFVYYGGVIGAFILSFVWLKKNKLPAFEWLDFFAPVISFGYAAGRIACFLTGCCYGRSCPYPWGVKFLALQDGIARHPTQLYAVFWESLVVLILLYIEKEKKNKMLVFKSLFVSSGSIFMLWLVLHSLGRILMEYYRDDFRGPALLGLSFSTWISLLAFAFGAAGLVFLKKRTKAY